MANEVVSGTTALDQEKFLASKLLALSYQKLVAASVCDKVQQPRGAGLQAYFIRYKRMDVPLVPLTEGVDPANSSFTLEQVTVTLDQWGDVITITDVAELTTKHPLVTTATNLLSDNAQRVIDREIQLVWLSGTSVTYGDGVVTSRAAITTAHNVSDVLMTKVRATMSHLGAPPRGGPSGQSVGAASGNLRGGNSYLAITDAFVTGDIMKTSTSLGTWVSVAMYNQASKLYNSEVGTWLGFRWVETNFIPIFTMLGNTTAAVTSGNAFGTNTPTVTAGTGGSLAAVAHFFKVTRKSKQRGFEEDISIEHSITPGATGTLTFNFTGLTAGYVYNVYLGTTTGDANLRLAAQNVEVGASAVITVVPGTGSTAPANVNPTGTPNVHVVYIFGEEAVNWVGLQSLQVKTTPAEASHSNPLALRRKIGYKFMAKAMIRDQQRLMRVEVTSSNG